MLNSLNFSRYIKCNALVISVILVTIVIWNVGLFTPIDFYNNELIITPQSRQQTLRLDYMDDYMTSDKIVLMQEMGVGYGNRIYAFLNVLSFAIITNRSIICLWDQIPSYIKPVPLDRVAFNKPVQYFVRDKPITFTKLPYKSFNAWKPRKSFDQMLKNIDSSLSNYTIVDITAYDALFFEFVLLEDTIDRFSATGLIKDEYVQEAKQLFTNQSLRMSEEYKIETAYRLGFDLAHTFLTKIWLPSDSIASKMSKIISEHFDDRTFVIGIQIRVLYLDSPNDLKQILNCAVEIEKQQNSSMKIKWYVATDQQEVIDQINSEYGDKVITASGQIAHIETRQGYERTIIDNEMLSKCDELIITGGSTFGMTAAMRMGRMPLYFNGKKNCTECLRMSFSNLGATFNNSAEF